MGEKHPSGAVSPVNGQPVPYGKRFQQGEEQRERAKRAGKRSAEVRAARKTLREELLALLREQITDKNSGRTMEAQAAMSTALIQQALRGNTKAYEIIRDTIGEKPVDNVNIVSADFSALEDAFKALGGASGGGSK